MASEGGAQAEGGFDAEKVALTIAAAVAKQGGQADVHRLIHFCPALRNQLAGRRLLPFVKRFPEKFEVTEPTLDRWVIRLLVPPPTGVSLDAPDAEGVEGGLEEALARGIEFYCAREETSSAPLRWLCAHRTVPKRLKQYMAVRPVAEWMYHHHEDHGGHESVKVAKGAACAAHLKGFVEGRKGVFRVEGDNVSLVGEGSVPPKRVTEKRPREVKERVQCEVTTAELLERFTSQDMILLTRVTSRTKELHSTEIRLLQKLTGTEEVTELRSGLWAVTNPSPAFREAIVRLAGVRRSLVPRVCASTPEDLIPLANDFLKGARVALSYERYYPEAPQDTLPFIDLTTDFNFLLQVRSTAEVHPDGTPMLVTVGKDFALLSEQEGVSGAQGWVDRWETRPFSFTGAMDAVVGRAIASVASLANSLLRSKSGLGVVVDACCGSGTLSVSAALAGAERVVGLEVRQDFADRAKENVEHMGLTDKVEVRCHDATEPTDIEADVVLSNPPWGKCFGTEGDTLDVLRGVVKCYPSALFCFMAPPKVLVYLAEQHRLTLHYRIPVGTVDVVVASQPPSPPEPPQ